MASQPEQARSEHDHRDHEPPCGDCDLSSVDDLACESKGVADRAKYIADHADALAGRRTKYDATRSAYTTARGTVAPDVTGIRKDLHQIREQLRCQLDRETIECLDEAWYEVSVRLEECGQPRTGCCVEKCDFDEECRGYEDEGIPELTQRITRIDRRVVAAEACFDALVGEPAALVQRVADLRKDVDALLTEIADPKTVDPKHAYAAVRWLWHRYDDIWWGFPGVRDFHDCLCTALTCSVTGRRVLGILVGRLGVLTCRKDAEDKRCENLRTHVVETVLEICARNCRPDQDDHKHDHNHQDHGSSDGDDGSYSEEPDNGRNGHGGNGEHPDGNRADQRDEDDRQGSARRPGQSSW